MVVTVLHLQDALAIPDEPPSRAPVIKNFFEIFGTNGCRLQCGSKRQDAAEPESQKGIRSPHRDSTTRAARRSHNKDSKKHQTWFTSDELASSIKSGCGSCTVIGHILAYVFQHSAGESPDLYEYSIDRRWELKCRKAGEKAGATVQLFQHPSVGVHFEEMPTSKLLLGRTRSISRLKRWLLDCVSTHKRCAARSIPWTDSMRPARLLDVTAVDIHGNPGLRLIETVPGKSYTYVCLSHRWDEGINPHKTTVENLAEKLTSIDATKLPNNFRDAVDITREVDIQYLWVDSICVVQEGDEGQDLEKEIAKMGYIYQNAHLVIAAVSSPNSNAGCFIQDQWPDICLQIQGSDGGSYVIGARMLDRKGKALTISDVNNRYPLLTRAWVFQERLLSTRLVQCNYGEFQYACLESLTCECTASTLAPHPSNKATRNATYLGERHLLLKGSQAIQNQGSLSNWKRNVLFYWRTLTHEYMQHSISYPSDVLPAIGGCAQVLAYHLQVYEDQNSSARKLESHRVEYVAGMWKDTLAMDLLWHVRFQTYPAPRDSNGEAIRRFEPGFAQIRPLDSTAPSWSWASIPMGRTIAHIGWDDRNHEWSSTQLLLDDEVLKEVYYKPKFGGNPFGKLTTAYLKLEATLYPWYIRFFCYVAKRENVYETRNRPDVYAKRVDHNMRCSTVTEEIDVQGALVELSLDANTRREDLATTLFTGCVNTGPSCCALSEVSLLHVLHKEKPSRTLDVFLVLHKIDAIHGKPNCYKRIGLWKIVGHGDNIQTWEQIVQGRITPRKEKVWLF